MKKYNPSEGDKKIIRGIYDKFELMLQQRNQKWKYLNDRTLRDFIDDSQLRLNGYVPSRESQGKETWQSNVFHPVTKNKFKAILAAVALDIPQTRIVASNENDQRDKNRAEIMRNLVKFSYDNDNKEEQIFFEAWECAEKGTCIVYDGYLKSSTDRKVITSYDPETGEVEYEKEKVTTGDQCVNFLVPLANMFVEDWTVFDIQKQPSLCWVERMNAESFKEQFGKYKHADQVKTSNELTDKNVTDVYFKEFWQARTEDDEPIEVIRYFNKTKDEFVILANGVLLFESPLLLGKGEKMYPFAKTVFEPFATDFFYGNSLPNSLMGEQDVINALFNMALDKTYKSMAPALLIGNTNKDDFDLEDQNTTIDTKIYVQDIAQVREMPISGIDQADLKMIELVSRGLDLSSVDANQQGISGRGVTAREVVIANENAKKLKGLMYLFLTSLWVQKMKLRTMNILIYYMQPKATKVLNGRQMEVFKTFNVENADLSGGRKGTLGIQMVGSEEELPKPAELDVQETTNQMQSGEDYEVIAMTSDYLDDWKYDIKIVSDSIYQKESGLTQLKVEDKLRVLGTYFPQILMMNQEKLANDTIVAFEDEPDEYDFQPKQQPQPEGAVPTTAQQNGQQGAGGGLPPLPPL